MHFVISTTVSVLLLFTVWELEATKECYMAKTCIHDAAEKCGIDAQGTPRRFLDTCDMLEYNCYYNGTYTKAKRDKCAKLPPIENDGKKDVKSRVNN